MIRLAITDDFPIVLDGLRTVFRAEPDIEIVGVAQSIDALRSQLGDVRPDVLIVGLNVTTNASGTLRSLQAATDLPYDDPCPRTVLFAHALEERHLLDAVRCDVRGIFLKSMPSNLLVKCVRKVAAGGRWIESDSYARALESFVWLNDRSTGQYNLSRRELEVLRLLSDGLKNREISARLSISEGTVKTHVHKLFTKLGADSRVSLVLAANAAQLL